MSEKLKIAPGEPPTLKAGDTWDDETGRKMFDGEKVVNVPTDEQIAAYQQQRFEAELKAQGDCKKALAALAESYGYTIVALPIVSAERTMVLVAADWGLQRKQ